VAINGADGGWTSEHAGRALAELQALEGRRRERDARRDAGRAGLSGLTSTGQAPTGDTDRIAALVRTTPRSSASLTTHVIVWKPDPNGAAGKGELDGPRIDVLAGGPVVFTGGTVHGIGR
jgi:hypothetical protein